jgi:exopolysaccharide production protein ExoZ
MDSQMSSNKLEGIQILRGYAAMLVVVTHLWSAGVISSALRFSRIGGLGVDIFFVISGFIMCYSLRDQISSNDSVQFLKKRVFRVYPIYLLVLIPFLVQYLNQPGTPVDPLMIIGNLLLSPSFLGGSDYRMLVGPAWTLTYELFFYALFAVAIFSSRSKTRAIYTVIMMILLMVASINLLGLKGERLQWSNFQYIVGDTLLLNFVIGCVCYFLWRKYGREVFSFWTALGAALVLTVVSLALSKFGLPRILSLGLPAGAIVLIFLFAEFEKRQLTRPLLFLGSASYSIYLIHAVIAHWKHLLIGTSAHENDLTGILLTCVAVAAGCIFYVVVENPISRVLHEKSTRSLPPAIPVRES